jgi:hypothetical protein
VNIDGSFFIFSFCSIQSSDEGFENKISGNSNIDLISFDWVSKKMILRYVITTLQILITRD